MKKKVTMAEATQPFFSILNQEIDVIAKMRGNNDQGWQARVQNLLADLSEFTTILESYELRLRLLIFGSEETGEGEFPECVAIGNDDEGYFASGVLLSENWLLTSSH